MENKLLNFCLLPLTNFFVALFEGTKDNLYLMKKNNLDDKKIFTDCCDYIISICASG